jgi:cell division protein FtsI/penicillin-binding protein 2
MKQQYQWRSLVLSGIFTIISIAIVFQIFRIQSSPQAASLRDQGDSYQGEYQTIYPPRGEIYDRNGHLLAGNKTVYEVGVNMGELRNAQTIALALNVALGMDAAEVINKLTQAPANQLYVYLSDHVAADKVEELQKLQDQFAAQYISGENAPSLSGLYFRPHLARSYPESELASNVLGFVSREDRGYYGIEEKYDDLLAGQPKLVWIPSDPNLAEQMPEVPGGSNLVLTIDREIQATVENILDSTLAATGAENGTIIVMDPKTGEILAMTSSPRLNLNEYWNFDKTYPNGTAFNRAISTQYEQVSVFKIMTMASALDTGTVAPTTPFFDPGYYEIGGAYIHNWDGGAWGAQDMVGCLEHSLNVCFSWIADEVGNTNFYNYMQKFGLGHPTGIDLVGEASGRLKLPGDDDWYQVDLGTNAFGQGVAVTPIQMMMAVSAVANDGKMVVPHIVKSIVTNGRQYNTPTQIAGTPISAQTARTLTEMLAQSLERGEGVVDVPGYRLVGKTGTAQIPGPGGYLEGVTNASFLGWGPIENPQFMVYIWLEKPQTSEWASQVAAPAFERVASRLVVLMNIPPDSIREMMAGQ